MNCKGLLEMLNMFVFSLIFSCNGEAEEETEVYCATLFVQDRKKKHLAQIWYLPVN